MDKDVKPYGMFCYFFNSDKRKKEKLYKKIVDALVENGVLEIYSNSNGVQTVYQWRIMAKKWEEKW